MNTNCSDCDPYLLRSKISESYSRICSFHYFFLALVGVVGSVGNILVLIITLTNKFKQKKNPDLISIIFLAFVDLFVCMFLVPYEIYKLRHYYSQTNSVMCKSFEWVRSSSLTISCFILLVVAVDRCKVISSMQTQTFGYAKRLRTILIAVVFVSVVLMSPIVVFKGIETNPVDVPLLQRLGILGYNETSVLVNISSVTICEYLDVFNSSWSLLLYAMSCMVIFVILIIITVVCYGRIYLVISSGPNLSKLARNRIWPKSTNHPRPTKDIQNKVTQPQKGLYKVNVIQTDGSPSKKEPGDVELFYSTKSKVSAANVFVIFKQNMQEDNNKAATHKRKTAFESPTRRKQIFVAKLLFLITGFFILSWTPFWVITCWYIIVPDLDNRLNKTQTAIIYSLYNLYFLNNAANPVLYGIYSEKFRLQCKDIFYSFGYRLKRIFLMDSPVEH